MGLFTVQWAMLEQSINALIWEIINIDKIQGNIITNKVQISQRINKLEDLMYITKPKDAKPFTDYFSELRSLTNERNNMMHWSWSLEKKDGKVVGLTAYKYTGKSKQNMMTKKMTNKQLMALNQRLNDSFRQTMDIVQHIHDKKSELTDGEDTLKHLDSIQ